MRCPDRYLKSVAIHFYNFSIDFFIECNYVTLFIYRKFIKNLIMPKR